MVHAVGASDVLGQRMKIPIGGGNHFATNTGPELEFAVPGEDVHTVDALDVAPTIGGFVSGDNRRTHGTSYAAPVVAGVASLIASYNTSLDPRSIEYILCTSGRDLPNWNNESLGDERAQPTCGLVDAEAALLATQLYIFHDDFEEGSQGIGAMSEGSLGRWSAAVP